MNKQNEDIRKGLEAAGVTDETVIELVKICPFCQKENVTEIPAKVYISWIEGAHLQNVWPESTADQREAVITGTHGECWDNVFADMDD